MESHLLQMRGLKLSLVLVIILVYLVASFTDAWIETRTLSMLDHGNLVASFTDAWIETAYPFRAYEAI